MAKEHLRHWQIGDVQVTRLVEVNAHEDPFTMLSTEVNLDQQGRVVIPASLREAVGIDIPGPLVTFGVGDRAEIWNPERYAATRTADAAARRSAKRRGLQRTPAERARLAEL